MQSFVRSLRLPEGGRWVKNWEFGSDFLSLKYQCLPLFILEFMSKVKFFSPCHLDKYLNIVPLCKCKSYFLLFATHSLTNFSV